MHVFEFDSESLFTELRYTHERSREIGYLEGGCQSRYRPLVIVGIEVEYELSLVRYAFTVADYEAKSSSAGARVVYLVTWCVLSGHHVAACTAVQDNLDHYVFPVVDSEDGVVLVGLNDAQLRAVHVMIVPMIVVSVGLIHQLSVSDSLRSGRIE